MSISSRLVAAGVAALVSLAAARGAGAQDAPRDRMTAADLGGVIVTVYVPSDHAELTPRTQTMLRTRLTSLVSQAGLSGMAMATPFVLYPDVAIADVATNSGGLQAVTTARVELALVVKSVETRNVIHQWTTTLVGSGRTRDDAIAQAIGSFRPNTGATTFAAEVEQRVLRYYETNCDAVRREAKAMVTSGRAQAALASLFSVPMRAAACHAAAMDDVEQLMAQIERELCMRSLTKVRAHIAAQAEAAAAAALAEMPAATACRGEVDRVVADLTRTVRAKNDQRALVSLETVRTKREAGVRMTKREGAIDAGKSTAVDFYNSEESRTVRLDILR